MEEATVALGAPLEVRPVRLRVVKVAIVVDGVSVFALLTTTTVHRRLFVVAISQ